MLLNRCPARVSVQEPGGASSTVINGASHNNAGFYSATKQSEELQRRCSDSLPVAGVDAAQLLDAATRTEIAKFLDTDFCYAASTGYRSNYVTTPALVDKTFLIIPN